MFADVSFPISSYRVFTYRVPQKLQAGVTVGVRVRAPFGSRRDAQGVVVKLHGKEEFKGRIKPISQVVDDVPIFDRTLWELLNWVSRHYLTPLGQVMRTAVPQGLAGSYTPPEQVLVKSREVTEEELFQLAKRAPGQYQVIMALREIGKAVPVAALNSTVNHARSKCLALEKKGLVTLSRVRKVPDPSGLSFAPVPKEVTFTGAQGAVVDELVKRLRKMKFDATLLHGVTGSGKTEIYIHLAKEAQRQGRRSIMLLPEISLTPQIAGRFRAVFGEKVAIWHSRMTQAQRAWTWRQVCSDAYSVVVGARSAVFTPLRNVGLIVVDEEQENAYKQESPAPRYHARDVALMRGRLSGALTLLAGATPSLESYYNQAVGKLNYMRLNVRYGKAKYPRVHIVNMMEERKELNDFGITLSRLLVEKIRDTLKRGEQVILLQNRRGFSPIVTCSDCGHVETCTQCNISLTFHKAENVLKCHYCNFRKAVADSCGECGGSRLVLGGVGT
ncbi:MAG: primosomal protein N', partial [Fidelibacterota bacterium]